MNSRRSTAEQSIGTFKILKIISAKNTSKFRRQITSYLNLSHYFDGWLREPITLISFTSESLPNSEKSKNLFGLQDFTVRCVYGIYFRKKKKIINKYIYIKQNITTTGINSHG